MRYKLLFLGSIAALASITTPAYALTCAAAMTVSTESDLNTALGCFNSSGTATTITLDTDIASSSGGFTTIGTGLATTSALTVDGAGFMLSSPAQTGNLLTINGGNITINDIAMKNTAGTSLRITNGTVLLKDSTIDNSMSSGVYASAGNLIIRNSTISDGTSAGVYVDGGTHKIQQSTISGNRLNGVDVNGGSMLLTNTTVTDNRIGVYGGAGLVSIANSTVAFNNDNGVEAGGGSITAYSSLVAFNAQSGPYGDCIQFSGSLQFIGKSNSSYESDGTCLAFSTGNSLSSSTLQTGDLQPLASNGCATQQVAAGGYACLQVHVLSDTSIAASKGDCRAATAQPAIPAAVADARGFARNSPCDSGAVKGQTLPGTPTPTSPLNLEVVPSATPVTVTFDAVASASRYQVQVYDRLANRWTFVSLYNSAQICSAGTCSADTISLAPQNYAVWRVRAYNSAGWSAWSSNAVFNVEQIVADTIAPTATIDDPAASSIVFPSPTLQGTITDTGGSGVAQLTAVIWRQESASFVTLDGTPTGWTQFSATLPGGNPDTATWTLPTSLPTGHYVMYVYPSDAAGNYDVANRASRSFTVDAAGPDTVAPSATITSPLSTMTVPVNPQVKGTVTDTGGSGVARLAIVIWKIEAESFVTLSGSNTVWTQFDATLPAGNPDTANWTLNTSLPAGTYRVFTYAYDAAGNYDIGNRVMRTFTVQ